MAHWTEFKSAWFPARVRIGSYRLRPFSLGHLRLLEIVESPFLRPGDCTCADFALALGIVRWPWRVSRWALRREWSRRMMAALAILRVCDWQTEAKALDTWVGDCLWAPDMYQDSGAPDTAEAFGYASSYAMRIAWKLNGGFPPSPRSAIWDMSIIEAQSWAVTQSELAGRGFVTRDEMAEVDRQVAEQVRIDAERATGGTTDGRQS